MVEAEKFNVEGWLEEQNSARRGTNLHAASAARELLEKYSKIHTMIAEKKLFGVPMPQTQGPGYEKPKQYLAIRFALTNLTQEEVRERIGKLHKRRLSC